MRRKDERERETTIGGKDTLYTEKQKTQIIAVYNWNCANWKTVRPFSCAKRQNNLNSTLL